MKTRCPHIIFLLFLCAPVIAYAQKDNSSNILLFQRDGSSTEISLSRVVTMHSMDCDSMSLNGVRYAIQSVTKIVVNPCDSIIKAVVAPPAPLHSVKLELGIYPNPTNGKVRFVVNGSGGEQVMIQVFSALGTLVHQFELVESGESNPGITWDFNRTGQPALGTGMYFIRASTSRVAVTHSLQFSK